MAPDSAGALMARPGATASPGALLMLAYYYPPQRTSGAARPARMARYLSRLGHRVDVISACLPDMPPDLPPQPGVHRVPVSAECAASGNQPAAPFARTAQWIERRLLPYAERLPWVPYAVAAGAGICRRRPVTILSTAPPVGTHLAAMELQRRYGVRWIADFRDPLRGNPFRRRRWAAGYDAVLERLIVSRADAVLANTDSFAEELRRRYPRHAAKISVLWNGYDPAEELHALPCPTGRKLLVHVGSLYGPRHPGLIAASLARLLAAGRLRAEEFRLDLIGPVENLAVSLQDGPFQTLAGCGALRVVDRILPQHEAQKAAAEAHALLLLDVNGAGAGFQVPAKLFEYIRIGRPVLAFTSAGSPVERILAQAAAPHVAIDPAEPPEAVDRKVASFLQLPSEPVRASDWFWSQFNAARQADTLSQIIQNRASYSNNRAPLSN